jgi:DNA polymerase kappa
MRLLRLSAMTSGELPTDASNLTNGENVAYKSLKYHLLGPSLTKAGQEKVDQSKVGSAKLRVEQ